MRFDQSLIQPTQRYLDALHELAEAELEMLRKRMDDPENWTYMEIFVGDISDMYHLQFRAGGEPDKPDYMGQERVMIHSSVKGASVDGPGGEP